MPEGTPTVTVTGSSSRQPAALSRIPFSDISVQNGAQRSHAIPQQMYQKSLPDLFKLIKEAQLPDGKLPFDPDNFLDNGQALPSNNSGAGGVSIFEVSQHSGSHPQINNMMETRLQRIYLDLQANLAAAGNDPVLRNAALVEANSKVHNLADTMVAISVGGIIDPAHPEMRAIYNRVDPNARALWPDWDSLRA